LAMSAREIRFAVKSDHGCSPHWKVRVGATRSDVYVSNRSTGSIFHVSLHEDPDHWHIKGQSRSSGDSHEVWLRWNRPVEYAPGFVRALDLTVTPAVVDKPFGSKKQTFWYQFPGPRRWVHFNVWLEHPLANRDDSCPESARWERRSCVGCRCLADGLFVSSRTTKRAAVGR
jgi:hypothetical protein